MVFGKLTFQAVAEDNKKPSSSRQSSREASTESDISSLKSDIRYLATVEGIKRIIPLPNYQTIH